MNEFSPTIAKSKPPPVLVLRPGDDVAIARRAIRPGEEFAMIGSTLTTLDEIPSGHKIALKDIAQGEPVRKYGQTIGFARGGICKGNHIHLHNLEAKAFSRPFETGHTPVVAYYNESETPRFQGYVRAGGAIGTRNYIAVISNVNCSASVSNYVRDHFRQRRADYSRDFPHVDGVIAFTHKSGCVIQPGEPSQILHRVLAGIARHPNISGYVMMGLGCEGNQLQFIRRDFELDKTKPGESEPTFLTIQATGGTRKSVEAGVKAVEKLLPEANAARRSPVSISKLILAENCGGSDACSGITANPALGWASDELIRHGGTSVLAETPEIYGAEHLLAERSATPEVAAQLIGLVRWWEEHVRIHGTSIDNNPSFGNKEGGLTTIFEKSLGAIAKGGQSPLTAIYKYAEPILARGLCFMDTPGFDPVSMTGLVAGGCNVGVFTTGRGSVYGCKPMPCIKVATTTALFQWMNEDMDLNAGTILDGTESVADVGRRILGKIIEVASGEKTKSELAGLGDEEFAPWILGPTL